MSNSIAVLVVENGDFRNAQPLKIDQSLRLFARPTQALAALNRTPFTSHAYLVNIEANTITQFYSRALDLAEVDYKRGLKRLQTDIKNQNYG